MNTESNSQTKAYIIAGAILLVLVIGVAIFLGVYKPGNTPSTDTTNTTNGGEIVVPTTEDVIKNILVAGVDSTSKNTDVIMIVSINQTQKSIMVTSLPRDTYVNPDKTGFASSKLGDIYGSVYTKTNSTTKEKDAMVILKSTIEGAFAITIDEYVLLDLSVFRDIVDKVGGITFDVPVDMDYEDPYQNLSIHLKKGTQTLDGKTAEQLIRFKASYVDDDLGRLNVMGQFLSQLYEKVIKMSLTESVALVLQVLNKLNTSLTKDKITSYFSTIYSVGIKQISTTVIPGKLTQDESQNRIYVLNKKEASKCISTYMDSRHTDPAGYPFDPQKIFTSGTGTFIDDYYNK